MKQIYHKFKELKTPLYIFLLFLIIFFPVIFLQRTLFYRDLSIYHYPLNNFVIDSLKSFQLPLWNPYLFCGFPQIASLQPPIFYPDIFLFLLFPFHLALSFTLIIHYLIAIYGIYLIGRFMNLSKESSLIGGFVFSLNGFLFEINNIPYMVIAISWIPYIFLFTNKFIEKPGLKPFLFLIFFSGLQLASGRLDYFYFTQLFLWIWLIYNFLTNNSPKGTPDSEYRINSPKGTPDSEYRIKNTGPKTLLMLILAFGISLLLLSVQILPSFEYIPTSVRYERMTIEVASNWALRPLQLLTLLFNNIFGDIFVESGISLLIYENDFNFLIYNIYIGIPAFLLLIYSIFNKRKDTFFFLICGLFFLVLSLGSLTPLFKIFYYYLPGFASSRYPIKLLPFTFFCFSILICFGAEALLNKENDILSGKYSFFKITIISFFIIFLVLMISFILQNNFTYLFNGLLRERLVKIQNINFILKSLRFAFLLNALIVLILLIYRFKRINNQQLITLIFVVVSLDFTITNASNLWTVEKELLYQKPEIVNDIEKRITDKRLYRIYRSGNIGAFPVDKSKVLSDFKNSISAIDFDLAVTFKINNAFGYEPSQPYKLAYLVAALNDEIPGLIVSNRAKAMIMRLMAIKYYIWFVMNKRISPPDKEDFTLIREYKNNGIQLWELNDTIPRFTFRTRALFSDSETDSLKAMLTLDKGNTGKDTVIIEKDGQGQESLALENKYRNSNTPLRGKEAIKLTEENNNDISLDVIVPETGYLIIADRFEKGWKAFDNGEEIPILKANYFQQAIRIRSGVHKIKLIYRPASFIIGSIISIITLVCLLIILLIYKFKRINKRVMMDGLA
jgi:hypothetical protein